MDSTNLKVYHSGEPKRSLRRFYSFACVGVVTVAVFALLVYFTIRNTGEADNLSILESLQRKGKSTWENGDLSQAKTIYRKLLTTLSDQEIKSDTMMTIKEECETALVELKREISQQEQILLQEKRRRELAKRNRERIREQERARSFNELEEFKKRESAKRLEERNIVDSWGAALEEHLKRTTIVLVESKFVPARKNLFRIHELKKDSGYLEYVFLGEGEPYKPRFKVYLYDKEFRLVGINTVHWVMDKVYKAKEVKWRKSTRSYRAGDPATAVLAVLAEKDDPIINFILHPEQQETVVAEFREKSRKRELLEAERAERKQKLKEKRKVKFAKLARSVQAFRRRGIVKRLGIVAMPSDLSGDKVICTVPNRWHYQPYQIRLQEAQKLWRKWAFIHSPDDLDGARIKLVDGMGNEVGGSKVWAGSMIWIKK